MSTDGRQDILLSSNAYLKPLPFLNGFEGRQTSAVAVERRNVDSGGQSFDKSSPELQDNVVR
jgi:hypothetical protein